ncbi:RcnB family protein [Affinibrenneria salicis]|uniref:RcnB family protein n=1 Tax=Affinibrenneria salicis TaxID=2590031 RepID=A0A5J5FQH1_9GAMM|nr:RcnB family protein [Affinibrenneria salicis]KAA8995236.1 RcnB family protein [Affinibrenneria salicis]
MKKTAIALILSLFVTGSVISSVSYAEGPQRQDNQRMLKQGAQNNQQGQQQRQGQQQSQQNNRQPNSQPNHQPKREVAKAGNQHGAERDRFTANGHEFRKGKAAPQRYRGDSYRVNDWRARGLRQPPAGQYWAYIDGNYVLMAAATGIITSIIIHSLQN